VSVPVTLAGRLTKDPELRYSSRGNPVTRFSVVTSRRVKDRETGEWSDADTTFWDCVAFGQLAENCAESLVKGTAVVVTGTAAQEEWETKDGVKRRSMKVTVEDAAPSLRWVTVKVARPSRSSGQPDDPGPWANGPAGEDLPF